MICTHPCFLFMVSQNTSQVQGEDLSPSTQDMNNEQYGPKHISAAQPALFNTQSVTSTTTSSSHMATGTPQNLESKSISYHLSTIRILVIMN